MVDQLGFEHIEFSGLWSVWEGRTHRNKAGLHTGVGVEQKAIFETFKSEYHHQGELRT